MPPFARSFLLLTLVTLSAGSAGCATNHWVRGGVEVRTFNRESTNVHVVSSGGSSFLVDSGYEGEAQALEQDMVAAGVDPAKLKAIILTHGHADHAGGARYFHERFHVPVIVGDGDQGMLGTGKNEKLCATGFIGRSRLEKDQEATYTPYPADVVVSTPTDLAQLTGIPGRVLPMPGHTKGSLVVEVGDVLLVGDLLRGSLIGSGAATHLYMCDLEANRRDIRALLEQQSPGAKWVFVGHFGPVTRESVLEHFEAEPR